ncbi:MAG: VCBS repeat-containing protein, partial [Deltaproteobacteria bacterium]|nr:VCBS repeat-containing protein [Deltaproteobacteria bacterium]
TLPFRIDTTVGDRLLVGDINGDGRDDLVVYRAMPRAFYRSLITDAGSLSDWALFASTATMGGVGPEDVVELADLDGDMLADLVWIAPKKTTFWVFTNDPPQWIALSGCGIDPAHGDAARVGDVTGDAKTDLVWMATSNMTTTLPILVQENTSSDALSLAPPLTWGTFTTPPDMAAGDQLLLFPSDGDAMADLLLYRQNYAVIERYTSTGDQFAPKGRVSHSWPIVPDLLASDLLNATAYSPKGTTMTDTPTGMVLELWNNCWPAEGGVGP